MKEILACHDTATGFLQTPAPHPGKQCGKEGKGTEQCCTISGVWILEKKFLQKIISMCFLPTLFLFIFFSCHGLKRIRFLGHFAWNQNKDLQLSPRRKEKAHTHSLTQGSGEERQAGAASLQAAKKADGKTKPGPSAERNWDTAAPLVSDFKSPCLTTDTCLGALRSAAPAWGSLFPSEHELSCREP